MNLPALNMDFRIEKHAAMDLEGFLINKRYHERQSWRSLHRLQLIEADDLEML